MSASGELVLSSDEVRGFADAMLSEDYAQTERDYKVAVHEVMSRLLAVDTLSGTEFPRLLSDFFERKLDLAEIGIDGDLAARVEAAASGAPLYGITNAFINLAGGRFGVNNFIWVPAAIEKGFGEDMRSAFAGLVDASTPVADRVESFRTSMYEIEERSKAAGGFRPEWKLVRMTLAYTAAILGSFDPTRYTFYHHGKLRPSYEQLVGPWPKERGGALYSKLCNFVSEVAAALQRQGTPVRDLIDAQSFLWLRAEIAATPERPTGTERDFDRESAQAARAVFETAVPESARPFFADLLAGLIELAEETTPGCWTANLFPDRVVLIVGNAYVLRLGPSDVFVTLDTRELDEPRTSELERLASRAWEPGEWRSAPTFRSFEFSYPDAETAHALFDGALRSAVVDLASRYSRSPFTEAYSQGLVDYLADVTARQLPSIEAPATAHDRRAWVFQANPSIYAIDRAVRELPMIEWTVRQHRADVHAGDRVYVWRSGRQAGVIAVGTVVNEPIGRPPAEAERPFRVRPEELAESELRVDVHVDQILDEPLSRTELATNPVLSQMTVIRTQRGTNFALTAEQDAALQALLPGGGGVTQTPDRRYFILQQRADTAYDWDEEGVLYHFTPDASGAWKKLSRSPGSVFVYYRPGKGREPKSRTYYGVGRIARIDEEQRDGETHFLARVEDYREFPRLVPRAEFDPRPNVQMSIAEIEREDFDELIRRSELAPPGDTVSTEPFTVETIAAAAAARDLQLPSSLIESVYAALESGKHVILTGPPGTGKTTLAEAVAEAAQRAGRCHGYAMTTATADWTTYETIGGLKPTAHNELAFEPGHFLEAIGANQWLVIDELNRSNFDRAFGQLFTVLSGQTVQLPYTRTGASSRLVLAREGVEPVGADVLSIPNTWRVIATMNVFDKSLLFEMSFALMRRFAFIEVSSPDEDVFRSLIANAAEGNADAERLAGEFLSLRKHKDLGPALFIDLAAYLAIRTDSETPDARAVAFDAFYAYLLPQFEGIDQAAGEKLFRDVRRLVGAGMDDRLRRTLNSVLGLELAEPTSANGDDEVEDEDFSEELDFGLEEAESE